MLYVQTFLHISFVGIGISIMVLLPSCKPAPVWSFTFDLYTQDQHFCRELTLSGCLFGFYGNPCKGWAGKLQLSRLQNTQWLILLQQPLHIQSDLNCHCGTFLNFCRSSWANLYMPKRCELLPSDWPINICIKICGESIWQSLFFIFCDNSTDARDNLTDAV